MKLQSALLACAVVCAAASSYSAAQSEASRPVRALHNPSTRLKLKANGAVFSAPEILHNFGATTTDAFAPGSNLIQAKDGNFYGVSPGGAYGYLGNGGSGNQNVNSCIYRLTPSGSYSVVYSVQDVDLQGQLVQGADGNLYGEELSNATNNNYATGLIYAFNIAQSTVVATYEEDGYPNFQLSPDSQGNLYGVTQTGGVNSYGSIFKLKLPTANPATAGVLSTVYSFTNTDTDGRYPDYNVLAASDGKLYGNTPIGCGVEGEGSVIFSFDPSTSAFKQIACLGQTTSYYTQFSPFVEASDGNLYASTTPEGGSEDDGGIFQLNLASQKVSTAPVYSFGTAASDPMFVDGSSFFVDNQGDLVIGSAQGGENNTGVISNFNVLNDQMTELYSFPADGSTGSMPSGSPVLGGDGNLYGTTGAGGANNYGTLYEFPTASMGYAPMITLKSSVTTGAANVPFKLTWQVLNAFSQSAQACFAFSSDSLFSGAEPTSGSVNISASNTGSHFYSLNCGGVETATVTVNVVAGDITITSATGQTITSTGYSYGAVPENSTPPTYTLTLTNNSGTSFPFGISKAGTTSSHYTDSTTCPATVAASASCTITFTYLAGAGSENDLATFTIAKQGFAFNPENTIALSAHSVTPGVITVSSVSHNYGTVAHGSAAIPYTFQVYNGTGASQTLNVSGAVITGGAAQGSLVNNCPATLPVNEQCSITYTLSPSATGSYEYDITLTSPATIKPAAVVKLTATIN